MAIPEWPVAVPYQTERDAWSNVPFRAPIETEMESGDVRIRNRLGGRMSTVTWARPLTATQAAAFINFVENTIHRGAMRFRMQVCLDGSTYTLRTVQMQPKTLKYTSLPGGRSRPSFTVLVFPPSVVS